jgi:hypothetical protein
MSINTILVCCWTGACCITAIEINLLSVWFIAMFGRLKVRKLKIIGISIIYYYFKRRKK